MCVIRAMALSDSEDTDVGSSVSTEGNSEEVPSSPPPRISINAYLQKDSETDDPTDTDDEVQIIAEIPKESKVEPNLDADIKDVKPCVSNPRPVKKLKMDSEFQMKQEPDVKMKEKSDDNDSEEDEVVKSIRGQLNKPRNHPPEIHRNEMIAGVSFHPGRNILAVASLSGFASFYKYTNYSNEEIRVINLHMNSCRDMEFSNKGDSLFACGTDKSIVVVDTETGLVKQQFYKSHKCPLYSIYEFDENILCSGDENGTVKVWDLRKKNSIMQFKESNDSITEMITTDTKKYLVCTCGDGVLSAFNMTAKKLFSKDNDHSSGLNCVQVFKFDEKVVIGSNDGTMLFYDWGEFSLCKDKYLDVKSSINSMVAVTENMVLAAYDDGIIRAYNFFPNKALGVVGQHSSSIEKIDISSDGEFVVSSSLDSRLKFWNIRFTKGLSADKINLSTFKGEGELCNLELDENVLTDLLALPSWLRLTHAMCSRVAFRVPWTKLKSVPIHLSLGEVTIIVETCEELRTMNCQETYFSDGGPTKYNFTNKVIDSVMVTVETVKITFKSPAFKSELQLSGIKLQSKSPDWKECELRFTRLKDSAGNQILLFKELEWQTEKFEAKSTVDSSLAPIKLILKEVCRCRIILKKSLSDSSILGTRLAILVDDLYWDLTDFQLKAALHFLDSILGLIQKATEETRKLKAAKKLKTFLEYHVKPQQSGRTSPSATTKAFATYDVVETSYHFLAKQIDLYFSDDIIDGRSCHPELLNGATFHVNFKFFRVDFYPYHLAVADRNHWLTYKTITSPLTEWLQESHVAFTSSLLDILEDNRLTSSNKSKLNQNDLSKKNVSTHPGGSADNSSFKNFVINQLNKIMTSCTVLTISDFNFIQIPSSTKKQYPKEFISAVRKQRRGSHGQGDRERWFLPEQEPVIHVEFTYSYFPGDDPFPLPSPKFYAHLNPIQIRFDVISILWLKAFALSLHQSLLQTSACQDASNSKMPYLDVKIEAIQLRILFESAIDHPGQKDRPKSLHIQSSRAIITNVRNSSRSSRADLEKCLDSLKMCSLFFSSDFPSHSSDFPVFNKKFSDHVQVLDNVRPVPAPLKNCNNKEELYSQLKPDLLWVEARDVWSIHLEPVFGDFYGTRAVGRDYPVPFLDAFPLTLWIYFKIPEPSASSCNHDIDKGADIHLLAHITTLVSVQLNHYQYLFLLRLSEEAKELATYLGIDENRSVKNSPKGTMVMGAVVPQVEVTLVMPSQSPGKESSGGDVESVYPDSSSLQDDIAPPGNWHSSNSFPGHLAGTIASEKKLQTSEMSLDIHPNSSEHPLQSSINIKTANGSAKMTPLGGRASSVDVINLPFQHSVPLSSFVSSIKKKFDKVMTLDLTARNSPDEFSDTVSVRSDASSGSDIPMFSGEISGTALERFTMDGVESLFNMNVSGNLQGQMIEVASEVNEDTITSPTSERDSFASYCKRGDLISLSTFKLRKVEFLKQSEGLAGAMKIQISSINLEECSSIPWDEFQNKFRSRSRGWVEVPLNAGVHPRIKLRITHTVKPQFEDFQKISPMDRNSVLNWFEDIIDIKLQSINLNMNASTLSGISDLVEDEILPVPFPITVHLEDIKLHIIEDRPPNNITSPGAVPLDMVITELVVHRDMAGVIEVRPSEKSESDGRKNSDSDDHSCSKAQRIMLENGELRRRLSALEGLSEEYYRLKKEKQETENNFRSKLEDAQNLISELLENKRELLDKLSVLNGELQTERNSKR